MGKETIRRMVFRLVLVTIVSFASFLFSGGLTQANATTYTVGDDLHPTITPGDVDGGDFVIDFNLANPSNSLPAYLNFRYGVWNGNTITNTSVLKGVIVNGDLIKISGTTSKAYWSAPAFSGDINITGLLKNGNNEINFLGNDVWTDFAIGSVDIVYNNFIALVPEPSTLLMLGAGLIGVVFLRRMRQTCL